MSVRKIFARLLLPLLLCAGASGCAALFLEDCPEGKVLGRDEPRIRSWRVRIFLKDDAAVAARFADYAAMSAYAYAEDQDCGHKAKLKKETVGTLYASLKTAHWERMTDAEFVPRCEDDIGLYYNVWKRETPGKTEVVIAFRGTWGFKDWWYGNLYWLRRWFTDDHQYARARKHAKRVVQFFKDRNVPGKALEFYSTGHSLGGGLAQAVIYEQPDTFIQAYAFDPSSATAYTSRQDKTPFATCRCDGPVPEARIYRIYESYEILSDLRIFHKSFFPPEPWINEIRFNYATGNSIEQHSMANLALKLEEKRASPQAGGNIQPWYRSEDAQCTVRFTDSERAACSAEGNLSCPASGQK